MQPKLCNCCRVCRLNFHTLEMSHFAWKHFFIWSLFTTQNSEWLNLSASCSITFTGYFEIPSYVMQRRKKKVFWNFLRFRDFLIILWVQFKMDDYTACIMTLSSFYSDVLMKFNYQRFPCFTFLFEIQIVQKNRALAWRL